MSEAFELAATSRSNLGSAYARRLRKISMVPGVLYGKGQTPEHFQVEHRLLAKAMEKESFTSSIVSLNLDGKTVSAVVKAIQRHPFKPKLVHIDFQRVDKNAVITMHVPLHFIGEEKAPGVKMSGGIITHLLKQVEVRCLPSRLPEFIEVDVSKLEKDQSIHLSELQLPAGVELVKHSEQDLPVFSISMSRGSSAKEDDAGSETGGTTAEK